MSEIRIIENKRNTLVKLEFKKIWKYRELMFMFAARDIKLQYIQTKFGIIWGFIQAFTAAFIVNLFFGILIKIDTGDVPYIIFAFPGIMAWYYFSYILNSAGTSVLQSQHIIKKIYFPKLILPLYKTIVGFFDFIIWFLVFILIALYYQFPLSINVIFLPLAIIMNIITGLSIAIWLSSLTIKFRDAFLIVPFLAGFGIFVTPVFFPGAMIPETYQFLIYLNPMAGVIALYRHCLLGSEFMIEYLYGFVPVVILFISGLYFFRRNEAKIADII